MHSEINQYHLDSNKSLHPHRSAVLGRDVHVEQEGGLMHERKTSFRFTKHRIEIFAYIFVLSSSSVLLISSESQAQTIDVSTLNGQNGFYVVGQTAGRRLGVHANRLCDINNDGIDDFLISDFSTTSYVIYGRGQSFPSFIASSTIGATYGAVIQGTYGNYRQTIPGGCLNHNGDSSGDLLLSDPGGSGKAFLVYGGSNLPNPLVLTSLNSSQGVTFVGTSSNANAGGTIAPVHNFRGDGFDSVLVGQPGTSTSFLVFGRSLPFTSPFLLSNVTSFNGEQFVGGDFALGSEDFNGDGRGDAVVGYGLATVSGHPGVGTIQIRALTVGNSEQTTVVEGDTTKNYFGAIAAGVGDVNNDGRGDLAVGRYGGSCGVLFGAAISSQSISEASLDSTTWAAAGVCSDVASLSAAGDFNGDGIADIVIARSESEVAVIFGGSGFAIPSAFSTPNSRQGRQLILASPYGGIDRSSILGIGDVNNDGVDDIAVGMPSISVDAQNGGVVAVIFGSNDAIFFDGFQQ